jgi:hypothetical protein
MLSRTYRHHFFRFGLKMLMKKDKDKSKEPFRPEDTPEPPQVMDVSKQHPESGDKMPEVKDKFKDDQSRKRDKNEKLLGESPIEIDDETTI